GGGGRRGRGGWGGGGWGGGSRRSLRGRPGRRRLRGRSLGQCRDREQKRHRGRGCRLRANDTHSVPPKLSASASWTRRMFDSSPLKMTKSLLKSRRKETLLLMKTRAPSPRCTAGRKTV